MSSTERAGRLGSVPRRRTPLRATALLGVLALAGAALAPRPAAAQGQNKIVYDTFDWRVYSSTHFRIYYYTRAEGALQKVASMAESAYDELSRRLNYQIPKPIPLLYYATHAEFEQNNVILNFIPEGVGAFAEPARNRMVLPIDLPDEKLQKLILHELTHIFQYEILFGGRLGRVITANVPTWFMEGMASYFADDEDEKDRMFLRDAVNSDLIPPITRVQIEGYTAYRYGHAFFDFIEAEWGRDAVRELVFEFRSFLGRDVSQALRRAYEVEPDDFDLKFRRYLRRKYLPLLAVKGEASEYGERFRVGKGLDRGSYEIGAAPSPSGDFVATITTHKDDVDVALFSTKTRRLYRNLTPGRTTRYEYISAQFLTTGPDSGRDLSFAPDGDRIAVFARRERGRQLFIFSAKQNAVLARIPVEPDMPLAPSFSPDGKKVVFSGISKNSRDIFVLDLETRRAENLTNDEAYDSAPVYSPDGAYVYHSKIVNGLSKIVRVSLADRRTVEQVTWGEGNDDDAALSPDGKTLYYASSRGGIFNVYGQSLATGEILQYTDVIGAALGPSPFVGPDGQDKVLFSGFQAGRFQLYMADVRKPVRKLEEKALPPSPLTKDAVAGYVPAVEVSIDPDKVKKTDHKLFVDDAGATGGIQSDGTFVAAARVSLSDYLGDRRAIVVLESIAGYSNIRAGYYKLNRRLQWGVQAYDLRSYFVAIDPYGQLEQTERIQRDTGIALEGQYPFSRYTRVVGTLGFVSRSLDVPYYVTNADGSQIIFYEPRSDDVPTVGAGYSYDSVRYKSFGPHGGQVLSLNVSYMPDLKDGGSLSTDVYGEARAYVPLSRRTLLAFRLFGGYSTGAAPNIYYFGGADTLRGYDYRTLIGNRAFYLNAEFRFPLIDVLSTGFGLAFGGVRGRFFVDVGGAWLEGQPFDFWDSETNSLKDGRASWGAGFSVFFLGVPWNVDFARQWNFKENLSGWETSFWIGYTF